MGPAVAGRSARTHVERVSVSSRPQLAFERSADNADRWKRRFEVPMLMVAALVLPSMLLDQPGIAQPRRRRRRRVGLASSGRRSPRSCG